MLEMFIVLSVVYMQIMWRVFVFSSVFGMFWIPGVLSACVESGERLRVIFGFGIVCAGFVGCGWF